MLYGNAIKIIDDRIKDMKFKSPDESVQNCTFGVDDTQLQVQQKLNGICNISSNSNFNLLPLSLPLPLPLPLTLAAPLPVNVNVNGVYKDVNTKTNDITKPFILLNGVNSKKSISRKTCTCSGGMVPCPSHVDTERSSINGYTHTRAYTYTHAHSNIKEDKMKSSVGSKNNLKTSNSSTLMPKDKRPRSQCCSKENGRISISNKAKRECERAQPQFAECNELGEDVAFASSRTFTIKSSKSNLNNCEVPLNMEELKLSIASLISNDDDDDTTAAETETATTITTATATTTTTIATTIAVDEKQTSEIFEKWLAEKKRQEREIRLRELNLKQLIEQEKQKKIKMERENFVNWLHSKKQKEKEEMALKKAALEEEQRRKGDKLKREEINKKQYRLWLKLKEEQYLVKKMNEQKRKIEKEEMDRQRLERNKCAFQEWLISSKDKPKPVPLNQGLESLRTSTSVSFVNPAAWVPNIVEKPKATSK